MKLYCTFQDPERLYFVLTYAKNGELLSHINKSNSFSYACVQYYTAEIVLALESLCSKGIIHRDLKPENILFDENWHILITDFGSAKILNSVDTPKISMEPSKSRKNSFVGTAQYVSPELLTDSAEASFSCDLWALGCIIYQMVAGVPPFRGGSEYLIFQKILKLDYEFPEGFNQTIRDLVENLLVLDPNARLGSTDTRPYSSIREHEFFKDVNWTNLGVPPIIASREIDTQEEIIEIPDDIEPGLDEQKASRLHLEQFYSPKNKKKISDSKKSIVDIDKEEIERQLLIQKNDKWHNLVEGNLILKKGLVDKRKGLFPRRRMLLLTLGPHLYYVDPTCMVLKGEIPWSSDLKVEAKNFKTFFVHTVSAFLILICTIFNYTIVYSQIEHII